MGFRIDDCPAVGPVMLIGQMIPVGDKFKADTCCIFGESPVGELGYGLVRTSDRQQNAIEVQPMLNVLPTLYGQ